MKTILEVGTKKYTLKYLRKMPEAEVKKMKSFMTNKGQKLENVDILALGARASDCVARACNRAIYEADAIGNSKPGWKHFFESK